MKSLLLILFTISLQSFGGTTSYTTKLLCDGIREGISTDVDGDIIFCQQDINICEKPGVITIHEQSNESIYFSMGKNGCDCNADTQRDHDGNVVSYKVRSCL